MHAPLALLLRKQVNQYWEVQGMGTVRRSKLNTIYNFQMRQNNNFGCREYSQSTSHFVSVVQPVFNSFICSLSFRYLACFRREFRSALTTFIWLISCLFVRILSGPALFWNSINLLYEVVYLCNVLFSSVKGNLSRTMELWAAWPQTAVFVV